MFYLTTHSTHYLGLYGIKHGKGPLSKRGNLLLPDGLLQLAARDLLYALSHRHDSIYKTFVISVLE